MLEISANARNINTIITMYGNTIVLRKGANERSTLDPAKEGVGAHSCVSAFKLLFVQLFTLRQSNHCKHDIGSL